MRRGVIVLVLLGLVGCDDILTSEGLQKVQRACDQFGGISYVELDWSGSNPRVICVDGTVVITSRRRNK